MLINWTALPKNVNIRFLLVAIILLPLIAGAITPPDKGSCPKKKKNQEDSVQTTTVQDQDMEDEAGLKVPVFNTIPDIAPDNSAVAKSEKDDTDDAEEVQEDDPNAALSFNFIYYIIEKFKFTGVEE